MPRSRHLQSAALIEPLVAQDHLFPPTIPGAGSAVSEINEGYFPHSSGFDESGDNWMQDPLWLRPSDSGDWSFGLGDEDAGGSSFSFHEHFDH